MIRATRTYVRFLRELAKADALALAAYREPEDFARDGRYFPGAPVAGHPRVRHADGRITTVSPGIMQRAVDAGHVAHADGDSGDREWRLTEKGVRFVANLQSSTAKPPTA